MTTTPNPEATRRGLALLAAFEGLKHIKGETNAKLINRLKEVRKSK